MNSGANHDWLGSCCFRNRRGDPWDYFVGGRELTLEYGITQSGVDPWNFMVGFNWDIVAGRSMQLEAATGGSRDQFVASYTQRF